MTTTRCNRRCIWIVSALIFILGIGLLSWASVSWASAPQASPDVSAWTPVLEESFDDNAHGWVTGENLGGKLALHTCTISDGSYLWKTVASGNAFASSRPELDPLTDFYLAVDIDKVSGSGQTAAALTFHWADSENYCLFELNEDSVRIRRRIGGEMETLMDWQPCPAVRSGEINRLAVIAEGPHLGFWLNDELVAEREDDALTEGSVGVGVSVRKGDKTTFQFDNFEVRVPSEGIDTALAETGEEEEAFMDLEAVQTAEAGRIATAVAATMAAQKTTEPASTSTPAVDLEATARAMAAEIATASAVPPTATMTPDIQATAMAMAADIVTAEAADAEASRPTRATQMAATLVASFPGTAATEEAFGLIGPDGPPPEADIELYPAPVLIDPNNGFVTIGGTNVLFRWQWEGGTLADDECFELVMSGPIEGPYMGAVQCSKATNQDLDIDDITHIKRDLSGNYYWTVRIRRELPTGEWVTVSETPEPRQLNAGDIPGKPSDAGRWSD